MQNSHRITPAVTPALLAMLATCGSTSAVSAGADTVLPDVLDQVVVIGVTPVPGMNVEADKVPANVQTLRANDLDRNGTADLLGTIDKRLGSVNINDTLADPFQPDILYRGFEASPVLGTPAGLAVYQNGVRVNEAFGDSVNWDLIPDIAIDRIDLVSASPLFGLNALGGAMSVTMKNGFTFEGGDAELAGGSFDQRTGSAEFGIHRGILGIYAAARALDQDGWRLFAKDSIRQYYLDLSVHGDGPTIDLSYARANNRLYGQGAAPVQSLALSTRNVFTGPQHNFNDLDFVTLDASYDFNKTTAVQSVVYYRNYRQTVANGNGTNYVACAAPGPVGALCQGDAATPLTEANGTVIPDLSNGGNTFIGENDFESIHSQTWGGSLQFTSSEKLFDFGNQFAVGSSIDASETNFMSGAQVGPIAASLNVVATPYVVSEPEGTAFTATPVLLDAANKYYGAYATDTLDVDDRLALTVSGRYNITKVDLSDRRGTALDGRNRFTHFNPAGGWTYKLFPTVTVFAGYSVNNRAPTAGEIECSDPAAPCLLPSSLAGDPPSLKQVVGHTIEAGVRGSLDTASRLSWNASVFRTTSQNDIYGIATSVSSGFFQNIGSTRRQGAEAGLTFQSDRWSAYAQYSFVDATFRSALTLSSAYNPYQDANGNITVSVGDHLPGIPQNRMKIGADYAVSTQWWVGGTYTYVGSSFYQGDASNQNAPLPGYSVFGLRSTWQVTRQFALFASVQNLLDRRYATYGLFSDPTGVGAPGIPPRAASNDPSVDNRFQSPAMPRAYFGGVRFSFR